MNPNDEPARVAARAGRGVKDAILRRTPAGLLRTYRLFRTGDFAHVLSFLSRRQGALSFADRLRFVRRIMAVSRDVECVHLQGEILAVAQAVFAAGPVKTGVVVEAGCFKGGSTAKLSVMARMAGRRLVVFDSFQGIPDNAEDHGRNIYGGSVAFQKGDYCGTLDEVKENVRRHGDIEACTFVPGFFDATMPGFREQVVTAFVDVDLASSTRTCLKYLYPLLIPSGYLFSQDGHLPLVLKVFADDALWAEIGWPKPELHGAGRGKLVWVRKPAAAPAAARQVGVTVA